MWCVLRRSSASRTIRPLAVVFLTTFSLACGGGAADRPPADAAETGAAATAGAPRDACALLTPADVQSVLGQAIRDSLALAMPGGGSVTLSQCNYATAENPAAVSLLLRRSVPGEGVDAAAHGARQTLLDSGVQPDDVPGLGTVAFWGGNQLHVFTDSGWYLIVTPVASAGLPQARALAERALAKLAAG